MFKENFKKMFFCLTLLNNVAIINAMDKQNNPDENDNTIVLYGMKKEKELVERIMKNQLTLLSMMGKKKELLTKYANSECGNITIKSLIFNGLKGIGIQLAAGKALILIQKRINNEIYANNPNSIFNTFNTENINDIMDKSSDFIRLGTLFYLIYTMTRTTIFSLLCDDHFKQLLIENVNSETSEMRSSDEFDRLIKAWRSEKARKEVLKSIQKLECQKLHLMHNFLGFRLGEIWRKESSSNNGIAAKK